MRAHLLGMWKGTGSIPSSIPREGREKKKNHAWKRGELLLITVDNSEPERPSVERRFPSPIPELHKKGF